MYGTIEKIKNSYKGVFVSSIISIISISLSDYIGVQLLGFTKSPISSVVIAIIIGIAIGNSINLPNDLDKGLRFSTKEILRFGIILMGIRIGLSDMIVYGSESLLIVGPSILLIITLTRISSRFINLPNKLTTLITVGTSICGATAIIATAPVIGAKKEEIAYAIANITLFGLFAMIFYPQIINIFYPHDPISAGIFLGSSIHETAQVAGAGMIYSDQFSQGDVLDISTITKLIRNAAMIIVIPYFSFQFIDDKNQNKGASLSHFLSTFPMFIIGFISLGIIRSVGDMGIMESDLAFGYLNPQQWDNLVISTGKVSKFALIVAMSAVGMTIKISSLKKIGFKAFYYGFVLSFLVGFLSIVLIELLL